MAFFVFLFGSYINDRTVVADYNCAKWSVQAACCEQERCKECNADIFHNFSIALSSAGQNFAMLRVFSFCDCFGFDPVQ